MLFTNAITAVALLASQAAAHGAVTSYVIDGTTYPGSALPALLHFKMLIAKQLRRFRTLHQPQDHSAPVARLQPYHDRYRQ